MSNEHVQGTVVNNGFFNGKKDPTQLFAWVEFEIKSDHRRVRWICGLNTEKQKTYASDIITMLGCKDWTAFCSDGINPFNIEKDWDLELEESSNSNGKTYTNVKWINDPDGLNARTPKENRASRLEVVQSMNLNSYLPMKPKAVGAEEDIPF